MEKLFVSYEIAKQLKEKGFNEPCFGYFNIMDNLTTEYTYEHDRKDNFNCLAPLYQQVIDWFREKHNVWIEVQTDFIYGTDIYLPVILGGFNKIELEVEGSYYEALTKAIQEALKLI